MSKKNARKAAIFALAPTKVRQAIMGREIIWFLSGKSPLNTNRDIGAHLPSNATSVMYPGPADDVSPIVPLFRNFGYSHFVYVDSAPADDGDAYHVDTFDQMIRTITEELGFMKLRITRFIHDPTSSRIVWLLMYGRNPLVLEYFYNTDFEAALTKTGRAARVVMMRRFAKVTGLFASGGGGPGPREWFKRSIFPRLNRIVDTFQIKHILSEFYIPRPMRGQLEITHGPKQFINDMEKYGEIRGNFFGRNSFKSHAPTGNNNWNRGTSYLSRSLLGAPKPKTRPGNFSKTHGGLIPLQYWGR